MQGLMLHHEAPELLLARKVPQACEEHMVQSDAVKFPVQVIEDHMLCMKSERLIVCTQQDLR